MFGPNLADTRGETVRQKPVSVVMDYIAVTRDSLKLHKFGTIVADVMLCNNIQILSNVYLIIKFVTFEKVLTHTSKKFRKS